jgi:hypothetical protein
MYTLPLISAYNCYCVILNCSIIAQGDKEDLERFSKTLNLPERGKVYVKGIFDNTDETSVSSTGISANSNPSE